jgi:hypothetical protein
MGSMDAFTQRRVTSLRDEIAALQHDNEVYREQERHTQLQASVSEGRRRRLIAIREELLIMTAPSKGKPRNRT